MSYFYHLTEIYSRFYNSEPMVIFRKSFKKMLHQFRESNKPRLKASRKTFKKGVSV